ncbi:unnamed protein product [Auanema sp. JU1783]|nr:unnamed protein product [Auanema sp. JU1783]
METQSEIEQLRGNAENLAKCLHALLEKIEELERKRGDSNGKNGCELKVRGDEDENEKIVSIEDNITTDPVTGLKKRTIVTERVLTTKTFHSLSLGDGEIAKTQRPLTIGKVLCSAYQSRAVKVDARQLNQIETELISGQLVVTNVNSAARPDIHPGDTITEVNGETVTKSSQIKGLVGKLVLTLVPAPIHNAPPLFYRVLCDYSSSTDENGCKWLPIELKRGDVIQVMSEDGKFTQGRKINDLSKVGYIPSSLAREKVK